MNKRILLSGVAVLAAAIAAVPAGFAQSADHITTPKEAFGHDMGEDYYLANYTQLSDYFKTLAKQSDRAKLVDIGTTAEGRSELMMIVSDPENMKNLDHYQDIARRLARAEDLTPEQAHALAAEGKSVVWIDGGMHATEVEHGQALIAAVYHALVDKDPEWQRILKDTIILFAHDNPDGQELVANWYMRPADPKARSTATVPRLWQKYIGHDNNRDFYMSNQPESTNINKVLFRQWYPQIIYNHHQAGPPGTVVFMPPFRDPFNYVYNPLIISELEEVGATMHSRLIAEDKPGSTSRSGAAYSTWFNGSLRTISYFHNSIGLLTEIIGNPTPELLPLVARDQLPHNDLPHPVKPQLWHLSQSLEYSLSINRAVLDYASRNREKLLYNIYNMGSGEIAKGSRDNWTITPTRIDALNEAAKGKEGAPGMPEMAGYDQHTLPPELYDTVLHDPTKRDARGYVIPADQADFPTAITFLNALIKTGVDVQKASAPFTIAGKTYPAGSFVVMAAQAYRPQVLDMFEPQDYPQDFQYPGGPPSKPYDAAGYTLAYQMNVAFVRITDGFSGPFQKVSGEIVTPAGHITGSGQAGWLIGHETNNVFILTNRLLKSGAPVSWMAQATTAGDRSYAPGAVWVPYSAKAAAIVQKAVADLGIDAQAVAHAPTGTAQPVHAARIALADVYGGSMPSGWMRWLYEKFEFPFKQVFPQEMDAGKLKAKYDVMVVAGGTYPPPRANMFSGGQPAPETIPAEMRGWLGKMTPEKTVPQIDTFTKEGGTLITVGPSNAMAVPLGLPVRNVLQETGKDGKPGPLPGTKFYIPGSLLDVNVDTASPIAYGMPAKATVFFDNSPAYVPVDGAADVKRVAWYASAKPLKSGWAWGQERLKDASAVLDVTHGKGHVVMLMPEVTQRGQSYGTFKLMFNSLYKVGAR